MDSAGFTPEERERLMEVADEVFNALKSLVESTPCTCKKEEARLLHEVREVLTFKCPNCVAHDLVEYVTQQ